MFEFYVTYFLNSNRFNSLNISSASSLKSETGFSVFFVLFWVKKTLIQNDGCDFGKYALSLTITVCQIKYITYLYFMRTSTQYSSNALGNRLYTTEAKQNIEIVKKYRKYKK